LFSRLCFDEPVHRVPEQGVTNHQAISLLPLQLLEPIQAAKSIRSYISEIIALRLHQRLSIAGMKDTARVAEFVSPTTTKHTLNALRTNPVLAGIGCTSLPSNRICNFRFHFD